MYRASVCYFYPLFRVSLLNNIQTRFSETESTAILTVLMQRYRVEVLEEPQFAGETYEQRRDRLFKVTAGITLV